MSLCTGASFSSQTLEAVAWMSLYSRLRLRQVGGRSRIISRMRTDYGFGKPFFVVRRLGLVLPSCPGIALYTGDGRSVQWQLTGGGRERIHLGADGRMRSSSRLPEEE